MTGSIGDVDQSEMAGLGDGMRPVDGIQLPGGPFQMHPDRFDRTVQDAGDILGGAAARGPGQALQFARADTKTR